MSPNGLGMIRNIPVKSRGISGIYIIIDANSVKINKFTELIITKSD